MICLRALCLERETNVAVLGKLPQLYKTLTISRPCLSPRIAIFSNFFEALYYTAYSALRGAFGVAPAAAAANVVAAFVRVPTEMLKQRTQCGVSRSTCKFASKCYCSVYVFLMIVA